MLEGITDSFRSGDLKDDLNVHYYEIINCRDNLMLIQKSLGREGGYI